MHTPAVHRLSVLTQMSRGNTWHTWWWSRDRWVRTGRLYTTYAT